MAQTTPLVCRLSMRRRMKGRTFGNVPCQGRCRRGTVGCCVPASFRARGFPDAMVLLFVLIAAAQVVTYLLPAGEFDRDGRRVVPGSYHPVDADPLPPLTFLTAIPEGLAAAQDVIFFVLSSVASSA